MLCKGASANVPLADEKKGPGRVKPTWILNRVPGDIPI